MKKSLQLLTFAVAIAMAWVAGYKVTPKIKNLVQLSDRDRFVQDCRELAEDCGADQTASAGSRFVIDSRPLLWAHAGAGGEIFYANVPEAFDRSIALGFKVLEVDVSITADNVPVMSHCFLPNFDIHFDHTPTVAEFLSTKVCGKYTPMTLAQFLSRYEDFDGYVSIDQTSQSRAAKFDLIGFLEREASPKMLKKIVYQAYSMDDLRRLKKHNPFGVIHYCLDREAWDAKAEVNWPVLIPALKACGVASVSFGDMPIDARLERLVKTFKAAGFVISVANVNSVGRARKWMALGVDCFDSDFLTPSDF